MALPNTRRTADGNTSIFCFFSGRLYFSPTVIHMREYVVNTSIIAFPIFPVLPVSPLQIHAYRMTISQSGEVRTRFVFYEASSVNVSNEHDGDVTARAKHARGTLAQSACDARMLFLGLCRSTAMDICWGLGNICFHSAPFPK